MRAALVRISVIVALAGCSTEMGGAGTLPPLPSPVDAAATTAHQQLSPEQRWYERHREAITDYRNDIEVLVDELTGAPDRDATVMLCVASQQSERPEYEWARTAPGAVTAWAEAVDLTRWMVTSCAGGDTTGVRAVLPRVDAALQRFGGWVAESTTG